MARILIVEARFYDHLNDLLLAGARGTVVTRGRIVAEVWGRSWSGANRTLDVHVATLRTKLRRPELVATVRGVGYRLAAPDAV